MDREARQQYLRDRREEYVLARKSVKIRLLDEAVKRTGLVPKVVIRKLGEPAALVAKPRRRRSPMYGAAVRSALTELWTTFDFPCGLRLVPLLREQLGRLRRRKLWTCSDDVAAKLVALSPKTADGLLAAERQRLRLPSHRGSPCGVYCSSRSP